MIGITCPDVSPLLAFVSLFAPAVVRGNAIVIIPSEKYPTVALDFYQVSVGFVPRQEFMSTGCSTDVKTTEKYNIFNTSHSHYSMFCINLYDYGFVGFINSLLSFHLLLHVFKVMDFRQVMVDIFAEAIFLNSSPLYL